MTRLGLLTNRVGLFRILLAGLALLASTFGPAAISFAAPMPSPSPAGESLVVVWAAGGELFIWQGGDSQPLRIAGDDVIRPFLSPDGTQVAYLSGPGGDPQSLWICDISGSGARLLVDALALMPDDPTRRPWQIVWAAGQIYFNTLTGEQINLHTADDLWHADPLSGTVERLLPDGEGGRIFPAPDGSRLALASAGAYIQPGAASHLLGGIALYDAATGERRTVLDFPAVATGSEWRWYPTLRWLPDSGGVLAAIPVPNLIYGDGETALWQLLSDSAPVQLGSIDADFFGLPVFSADGEWIAYIDRRDSPEQELLTLIVAERDGSGRKSYVQGGVGSLGAADWLPDTDRFLYVNGAPGNLWIGRRDVTPARFPAADVSVSEIVWASESVFVLSTTLEGTRALVWGLLDTPSTLQTIALLDTTPFFDAVSP